MSLEKALRYNTGKTRFELVPTRPQKMVAEVYTKGAHKYTIYMDDEKEKLVMGKDISIEEVADRKLRIVADGSDNWRLGQPWMASLASTLRHIHAFIDGEDFDPELGTHHLANASWGLNAIMEYTKTHPELDDRKHTYLKPKKIGLDIDEVIADFVGGMMNRFPEITERPQYWNDPLLSSNFSEIAQDEDFWLSLRPKVNNNLPFEPHCYITSRSIDNKVTEAWLKVNGFPKAPLARVEPGESKVDIAKKFGVDIFVDDRYENFVDLNRNGVCTFLMDAPHNQRYNVGYKRIKNLNELV